MGPTDDQIRERLVQLLDSVDIHTTTERQLRKTLEEEFDVDLLDKKALIRAEIENYLDEKAEKEVLEADAQAAGPSNGEEAGEGSGGGGDEEDDDDDEDEPRPAKKKLRGGGGGFAQSAVLSPALAAFVGAETMARTQVVKAIWAYIKEHNLQDPANKRNILPDEKLGTFLKAPVTMFTMNKQLKRHIKGPAAKDSDDSDDNEVERAPKRKKAPKQGGGASNGFQKAYPVSDKMAEWVGKSEMSRPDLTRFFWNYIKEHDLRDPENKKFVVSDDILLELTGQKRFLAFGFMKYMSPHINPQD